MDCRGTTDRAPIDWPPLFQQRLQATLGTDWPAYVAVMAEKPPISLRINPAKLGAISQGTSIPWCKTGYYLPERPKFSLDPLLHAGAYYVQEASSMLLEQAWTEWVVPTEGMRILDLCAAPGGKSTHLLSLMPPDALLVANEVIHSRTVILQENLTKWGALSVVITRNDPENFQALPGYFDVIVVDAPCSGEGLFRKDPKACNEWSETNLQRCVERQRRILGSIWNSLKPGGVLIYSTCTYHPQENEGNLSWWLGQSDAESLTLHSANKFGLASVLVEGIHGYYAYPHLVKGEGFFISGLRKMGGSVGRLGKSRQNKWERLATKAVDSWQHWLTKSTDLSWWQQGQQIHAWPEHHHAAMEHLIQQLHVVRAGLPLAEVHRKETIPLPELAWSPRLNQSAFAVGELNLNQACDYLRKTDVSAQGTPGWNLVTFQGLGLGWAKQAGPRWINHYPGDWRLRMQQQSEWSLA